MKMPGRLHHEEFTPEARTADGELILSSESHEWLAEAVKRWNLHNELVSSLKLAVRECELYIHDSYDGTGGVRSRLRTLAPARGSLIRAGSSGAGSSGAEKEAAID